VSPFTPYPLFQWYPQRKDILLNLSMKWWNSAFNARGRRLILVLVQLREVKIYVAGVKALRKKKRQDETQFSTKIDGFLIFIPRWVLMYFFASFLLISPCVWPKLRVRVLSFSYFMDNSIIYWTWGNCLSNIHNWKNKNKPHL